jgi:hypothetical protein
MCKALLASLLFLCGGAVTAQVATPVPAPPPGDTIYKLAVDAAAYPNDPAIVLLDEAVFRAEADGRSTRTYRRVIQVLKETVVRSVGEINLAYNGDTQNLTLNWARVVKPTGEVISAAPAQIQEGTAPASTANPVYVNQKFKRGSLGGVAVGTIVDVSYTIETTKVWHPRDFLFARALTPPVATRLNLTTIDLPSSIQPRIVEKNLTFARTTTTANGRTVHTWAPPRDLPVPRPELFAPDSDDVRMIVQVGSPVNWSDIGRWYAELARDRYASTPALDAKVAEVAAKARTLDDSIRAVHRWVAQDIRYVSISLGLGGYQPRTVAQILETGFGDCKDKATLFIAALRKLGVIAHPVLLSSVARADKTLPGVGQFNHMIAAVAKKGGGYEYVDLTAGFTPYGRLPVGEQGGFALVVHPDGRTEEVTLPRDSAGVSRIEYRVIGTLSESGLFSGRLEDRRFGPAGEAMRAPYAAPLDSARRNSLQRVFASRFFANSVGDSAVAFDGKDFSSQPSVSIVVRDARASNNSGDSEILNNPLAVFSAPITNYVNSMVNQLTAAPPRKSAIIADRVWPYTHERTLIEITLPAGWKARLPNNVDANSVFGTYRLNYVQDGQVLRITREMMPARGTYPAERFSELMTFLKQIQGDNAKVILIDKNK